MCRRLALFAVLAGCFAEFPERRTQSTLEADTASAPEASVTDASIDPDAETTRDAAPVGDVAVDVALDVAVEDAALDGATDTLPDVPLDERCNDLDDDGDGVVDEGYGVGIECNAGVGACRAAGLRVCLDDNSAGCNAVPLPGADEFCNDVDDDCDGVTDEDFDVAPRAAKAWAPANDPASGSATISASAPATPSPSPDTTRCATASRRLRRYH